MTERQMWSKTDVELKSENVTWKAALHAMDKECEQRDTKKLCAFGTEDCE